MAKNILCIRLDALGDLLMTAPALRCLSEDQPDRTLTLLTSPAGQKAAACLQGVDDTIVYEAPWMKATPSRVSSQVDHEMIEVLRLHQFDAALIFTVFSQNPLPAALLCHLADIPLRAAYCRENPYQLLTHWVKEIEPEQGIRHEVRRHLDLVASLGCTITDERMQLNLPDAAWQRAQQVCQRLGVDPTKPWIVMHPGATAPSRRYPPQKFSQVARRLVEEEGYQIILTGSASERSLWETMQESLPDDGVFELFGSLDFAEFCSLIAAADLLISNNTAPVHIASSVGTPVVDLYALTNPQHTPWMVPHRVLNKDVPCRNCFKSVCPHGHNHCLRGVSVDEVVDAALSLRQELQESQRHVYTGNQCRLS
ncbi:lipopolysaccharide heptosyltransferase II [Oligoflexus tunisiensis]|uniref:lipopolysaccharide heptosyltransferase II n=1 Tax=Oligoflexus tunisiensis TaxID=708132 RepID=UPI00114CA38E|nr:lipopolysaccharide heptosyltransferase II [Oligoflexus tunisiensis]